MKMILSLLAKDLDHTQLFYEKYLGFKLTGSYPEASSRNWIELTKDATTIQFYLEAPVGTPKTPVLSGTVYLSVDADIKEMADLIQKDHPLAWEPERMDYGQLEFGIKDPNGYILAIAQIESQ